MMNSENFLEKHENMENGFNFVLIVKKWEVKEKIVFLKRSKPEKNFFSKETERSF